MLDRSLAIVGLVFTSITSVLVTLVPTNQPSEVTTIQPKVVTIQPTSIVQVTAFEVINAKELAPEQMPKGIPKDEKKRCPQWEHKFRQHGLPVKTFSYIAWRESRCLIKAHNTTLNRDKSHDLGVVQINSSWKTVTSKVCKAPYGDMTVLFKIDCNLKVAKYLYDNGGLRHWSL